MPEPRVAVLLPVRDAEETLPECLGSLRAQTLADHEVIAVDDGSSDRSAGLLARARRADPRLRVVRPRRPGLVAALNAGLDAVRAPLVARMDADDLAHPARLERQAAWLDAEPDHHVLGCRVRLIGAPGRASRGMRAYVAWSNRLTCHDRIAAELLVESPLVHPSVMLRASALRRVGGYRELDGPEDYDLWLRGLGAGWRFAKLRDALLDWRDRPDRLTRSDPRYAPERFFALKLAALEAGPLGPGRAAVVWGAGPVGKGWARALQAGGHEVAAFVEVDPRKLGRRVGGVPVVGVGEATLVPGALHLAAVGQPGARRRIRLAAAELGLREGPDLIAVA